MIGQYLSNTNENATVSISLIFFRTKQGPRSSDAIAGPPPARPEKSSARDAIRVHGRRHATGRSAGQLGFRNCWPTTASLLAGTTTTRWLASLFRSNAYGYAFFSATLQTPFFKFFYFVYICFFSPNIL